jgi:hypothetical protein
MPDCVQLWVGCRELVFKLANLRAVKSWSNIYSIKAYV